MTRASLSVVTLGVDDLARARRFYAEGFGWSASFEADDIVFFQLNGTVLGLWDKAALSEDAGRPLTGTGAAALAHNVPAEGDVAPLMARLEAAGGTITRRASAPPHGGTRGYVADPDGHLWEIAWNPMWPLDALGNVDSTGMGGAEA